MKRINSLVRFFLVGAVVLLLAGFAVPSVSQAGSIAFNLTSDHCTGTCGTAPFGTVTLADNGVNLTTVTFTVHLNNPNVFVVTGNAPDVFDFNAVNTPVLSGQVASNGDFIPTLGLTTGGSFGTGGTGTFTNGITCAGCGNGQAGSFNGDLVFTVTGNTIAQLTVPNAITGNVFIADILSCNTTGQACTGSGLTGNGNTGYVDATTPIPEPSTVMLYGLGISMLLVGQKWRKARAVRSEAS